MEDTSEPDERWLQYYILGKIAEKKKKEPAEYLQYYLTVRVCEFYLVLYYLFAFQAITLLDENNAQYPDKINYNNPQHLSVEALELHYRINASILKYLELHEGKDVSNTLGDFFKKCLDSSKFQKKLIPKEVADNAPKDTADIHVKLVSEIPAKESSEVPAKRVTESCTKINESTPGTNGTGFQEEFLNSLTKLDTAVEGVTLDEEAENALNLHAVNKDKVEVDEKISTATENADKEPGSMETDDNDVKIIEDPASLNVITISDSEEEKEYSKKNKGKHTWRL